MDPAWTMSTVLPLWTLKHKRHGRSAGHCSIGGGLIRAPPPDWNPPNKRAPMTGLDPPQTNPGTPTSRCRGGGRGGGGAGPRGQNGGGGGVGRGGSLTEGGGGTPRSSPTPHPPPHPHLQAQQGTAGHCRPAAGCPGTRRGGAKESGKHIIDLGVMGGLTQTRTLTPALRPFGEQGHPQTCCSMHLLWGAPSGQRHAVDLLASPL